MHATGGVNGVLIDQKAITGNIGEGFIQNNLQFGADYANPTRFFEGYIDEVRIWNYARSEAEFNGAMNAALEGSESGLIAYYNFEDGSGNVLTDITGNGHNGTLKNMGETDWVIESPF